MRKPNNGNRKRGLKAAFAMALLLLFVAAVALADAPDERRYDLISIDTMSALGGLERPSVQFPHDKHTKALEKQGKSCDTCHPKEEDGSVSIRFFLKKGETPERTEWMDLYHDKCIACHKAQEGEKPPISCGTCHAREPEYASGRYPMRMDLNLHYRHLNTLEEKCERCHHAYDPNEKRLVYKKGTESSCTDCHGEKEEAGRSAYRDAAHDSCVGCHYKREQAGDEKNGPISCAGCHDRKKQMAIKKVVDVPRLKRGQPDKVIMHPATKLLKDIEADEKKLDAYVLFNHEIHEKAAETCRVCHHETMKSCRSCHTLKGADQGDFVKSERAMHTPDSEHSCIGCHNKETEDPKCAGCHAFIGRESFPDREGCKRCHESMEKTWENNLADEAEASILENLDQAPLTMEQILMAKTKRPQTGKLSFTEEEIPEKVTVKLLSEKFEPATFPHRKIVYRLLKDAQKSKLATHFHQTEDMICAGCHHHSPVGEKPPKCISCHSKPFGELNPQVPGILGAYHRQCIGCHEKMELVKPTKDCTACHAKKRGRKMDEPKR